VKVEERAVYLEGFSLFCDAEKVVCSVFPWLYVYEWCDEHIDRFCTMWYWPYSILYVLSE
jgi:hypothetical protein